MFYDTFRELCERKGISCNKAALEMGLSNATPTKWKKTGATPTGETLRKVAEFFGVSESYLLDRSEGKEKPLINGDEELTEYIDMLRNRPECRMLFQISKNATKADVEAAVRIIEALREKD